MFNKEKLGIIGIVTGVIGIGYAYYVQTKVDKAYTLIDASIGEISKRVSIDVSEDIVNKAIDQAVKRDVGSGIRSASHEAVTSIRKDIQREVKAAVDSSYSDIRASVSKEVSKQVADIDISDLRAEVRAKAKELVVEKFNKDLDALLAEFNQNLSNVSKIYSSIAESMTRKKEPGTTMF